MNQRDETPLFTPQALPCPLPGFSRREFLQAAAGVAALTLLPEGIKADAHPLSPIRLVSDDSIIILG